MNIRITLLTFALLLTVLSQVLSQKLNLKFNHLTKRDGLSSATVNYIFQDRKGYMWFGTMDGLSRFDGHNFVNYKHNTKDSTTIRENFVTSIAEDSKGKIWVGTRSSGISVLDYESGKFTHYHTDAQEGFKIHANIINNLYIDDQDNVMALVGGYGLEVYYQGADSFFHFDTNDSSGLRNNRLIDIQQATNGKFYLSTSGGSLEVFDLEAGKFEQIVFDENNKRSDGGFRPLLEDSKGNLWIGGTNGVHMMNTSTGRKATYTTENGLKSNVVSKIIEDKNGNIWIGVHGEGLNIFDPASNSFQYFKNDPFDNRSLTSNSIQDIYTDRAGTIWVASFSGGLNSYNPNREKFKTYRLQPGSPNSLNTNLILGFDEDQNQRIWIGTDGGGLNMFDPKTEQFKHYTNSPDNENTPGSNVVRAVHVDAQGMVWLGTFRGGLNSFNPETEQFTRYYHDPKDKKSIAWDNVWSVFEESNGNLIVGMLAKGIDVFDREKGVFKHYKGKPWDTKTLLGRSVNYINEDSDNKIWIGTEQGLSLFDIETRKFKRYTHDPDDNTTLIGSTVYHMLEDKNGTRWFATKNGISIYDSEKDLFINPSDLNENLPSLQVNAILEDDQGNLWISTNNGLSRYDPIANEIENYNITDGLQDLEFSAGAALKTKDGLMYFGGVNGFNVFDPSKIVKDKEEVGVVFSKIRLFDKVINMGDTVNGKVILKKDLSITKEITLTHKENVLAIEFSALDYVNPGKNLYSYMMEGFDDGETITDALNRKATYTNLDPDKYTFKVKASNYDGVFSADNYIRLVINILPPWWKTWWFRTLLVISTLAAIYYVANWRIRTLNKQKRLLQDEVDKHTGKLREVIEILREKSEQISKSGFNLKQKSGVLAEDAQLQTENAKRIEGSIEVVIDHTRRNSENATKTNKISENTVRDLEKIQRVNENNLKENQVISNKVSLLEEIFKQTNILSINAAIEAARAGGYGSGFSIIANEVKKLAERSRTASLEISGSAQNGFAQTEEMEELLLHFVPEMQKSVELIKEISESSKKQTNSVDIMTQSLREFFKISRKNADISNEIYSISSELDELAKYLNNEVQNIKL